MATSAREQFVGLIAEINKDKGLDELTSRIIGILYIEPEDVALEELASSTGYSLSAVSNAMKLLVRTGLVKRRKRPGSKRVYFTMEKDLIGAFADMLSRSFRSAVSKAKSRVPEIIEAYRKEKGESSARELEIVERYYKQLLSVENLLMDFSESLEKLRKGGNG